MKRATQLDRKVRRQLACVRNGLDVSIEWSRHFLHPISFPKPGDSLVNNLRQGKRRQGHWEE